MATAPHFSGTTTTAALSRRPRGAPRFYAAMSAALVVATALAFVPVSPIRILYVASIAGGIGTPVSLLFLLRVGRDRSAMRGEPVSRGLAVAAYVVAVIVTVFGAAAMFTG